jgi:IclR family transcriptional regulator, pca regulon regulatory protein
MIVNRSVVLIVSEVKRNSSPSYEGDPRFMTSLARGLEVLCAFEGHAALTVTQAAKLTGLPRSSVARCLFTLESLGYVAGDGTAYRLRPSLLPLARAFSYADPLTKAGQPIVNAVRDRLKESCSLAMLDTRSGYETVVYICRAETSRIISVPLLIGSTLPSYCTSIGRVLLAALPDEALTKYLASATLPVRTAKTITTPDALKRELSLVRERGWAMTDGELEPGLRSIAVPVRKADGQIVAALNLATQSTHCSLDWLTETALPELQAAAAHLARVS